MEKIFHNLDLTLYEETLDNGLKIYIVPKDNCNNIYATFTTKYGSVDTKFLQNGKEIISPNGIAHFLEHKMFEQKNGKDPFEIFDKNGANSNAATSNYKTTYLFSGPTNFEENITTLLDFVQDPYFTDENVEKEKGIIKEEIKMCDDSIERVGYNKTLFNSFVNEPIRIPVIGNIESINSITKEDLYTCYKSFYHPSNMFLVITGNVNPKKTISIIKKNQSKKQFEKIETKKIDYKEPKKVYLKKEIKQMNISIPRVYYSYKLNIKDINLKRYKIMHYLSIYFDSLFGSVSDFEEEILNEKITNDGVEFFISKTNNYLLVTFVAETKKPQKLIKKIKKYIGSNITIDDFNRKKKIMLSSNIFMSDNIFSINNKITNDVLETGEVITDIYKEIEDLNFDKLNNLIDNLSFKNTCEVLIKPIKRQK